jgi:predicted glutamine amidotransferase
MCRLFGLSASPHRVHASFWLLEAPDSFVSQSHRNPDGTGLGFFDPEGAPVLDKEPLSAFEDAAFARESRHISSTTFVSHIRFATTGEHTVANTHPFALDGRIFAHNGVLRGLDRLELELGDDLGLVQGETDSERYFALITREIRLNGGDVGAGIAAAGRWLAANLPVYSINCLLATEHELWAFRYPDTHRLFVLEREAGGPHGGRVLHHVSAELRVHSEQLAERSCVVVASEPLDDHAGWRLLEPGELVHIGSDLVIDSAIVVDFPPAELIHIDHPTGQQQGPTGTA